jgi:hypothetical protein
MEEALDETVRALQKHLNMVQVHLRNIAHVVEQDGEYEEELKLSWAVDEDLLQMGFLFEDLRGMCLDLISVPSTAEEKALAKKFKIDRKEYERKAREANKEKLAAEKAAYKASKKTAQGIKEEPDTEMKQ